MRKKGFKGRCEKRVLGKSKEVCRTYDAIQYACADRLQEDDGVQEIRCNVPLDGSGDEIGQLFVDRISLVMGTQQKGRSGWRDYGRRADVAQAVGHGLSRSVLLKWFNGS